VVDGRPEPEPSLLDCVVIPSLVAAWIVFAALGSSYDPATRSLGSAGKVALPVMLVVAELPRIRRRGSAYVRDVAPGALHAVVAALLVFGVVSAAWSVQPRHTLVYAAALGLMFAAVLLGPWRLARSDRGARALGRGILFGAAAVLIGNLLALALAPHLAYASPYPGSPARFRGFLENPDEIGSYVLVAPLALWWVWDRLRRARTAGTARRLRVVVPAVAVALLLPLEIVLSGGRSGIALLGAAIAIFLVGYFGGRRGALAGAAAVLLCGLLVVAALSLSELENALPSSVRPSTISTLGGRTEAWSASLHLIGTRPVGGYGLGSEEKLITLYGEDGTRLLGECEHIAAVAEAATLPVCSTLVPPSRLLAGFSGDNSHDSFIGLGIQLGVCALVVTIGGLLAVVWRAWTSVRRRDTFSLALLTGVVAGIGWGIVETYMFSPGNLTAGMFWVLVALALAFPARSPTPERVRD
jgi:hypothetical protein